MQAAGGRLVVHKPGVFQPFPLREELRRAGGLHCNVCKKAHASIQCEEDSCRRGAAACGPCCPLRPCLCVVFAAPAALRPQVGNE